MGWALKPLEALADWPARAFATGILPRRKGWQNQDCQRLKAGSDETKIGEIQPPPPKSHKLWYKLGRFRGNSRVYNK